MELYIGGYAQGKLTYVRKKYPGAQIYDENSWQQTKSGCVQKGYRQISRETGIRKKLMCRGITVVS